jgi:hypothetical protein
MYSKCSQRCAISRYIGVGTYDSDLMKFGKILTISANIFVNNDNWWYNRYHHDSAYEKLDQIGLDINFNKYYNHGIELRFIDHISDSKLIFESFEFLIYLMDYILDNNIEIINPIYNEHWNNIVYNVMISGTEYNLTYNEIYIYKNILNINLDSTNIKQVYYEIYYKLLIKYNNIKKKNDIYYLEPIGLFSKLTLTKRNIEINDYEKIKKYIPIKEELVIESKNKKKNIFKIFKNICNCTNKQIK